MKTLLNKITIEWLKAAAIRALRTMAQTALGMLTIGAAINEINWVNVASVAFVAAVYSMLTSLATTLPEIAMPVIPEPATDGVVQIDSTGVKKLYNFSFLFPLEELPDKTQVTLTVDPNAVLTPAPTEEPSQE